MAKRIIVEHIRLESSEEDVGPPPPDLAVRYNSIDEWMCIVCDAEEPLKAIECYAFGLFESQVSTVVCLVGVNYYDNHTAINFQPSNMYCPLPKEYSGLDRDGISHKLAEELEEFTKTKKFELSFLSRSQKMILNGNILIWSNSR
jgi:hypothetical protein